MFNSALHPSKENDRDVIHTCFTLITSFNIRNSKSPRYPVQQCYTVLLLKEPVKSTNKTKKAYKYVFVPALIPGSYIQRNAALSNPKRSLQML